MNIVAQLYSPATSNIHHSSCQCHNFARIEKLNQLNRVNRHIKARYTRGYSCNDVVFVANCKIYHGVHHYTVFWCSEKQLRVAHTLPNKSTQLHLTRRKAAKVGLLQENNEQNPWNLPPAHSFCEGSRGNSRSKPAIYFRLNMGQLPCHQQTVAWCRDTCHHTKMASKVWNRMASQTHGTCKQPD